jgi:hypothetical protein
MVKTLLKLSVGTYSAFHLNFLHKITLEQTSVGVSSFGQKLAQSAVGQINPLLVAM